MPHNGAVRSRYADADVWVDAADRAIKTSAATLVGVVGSNLIQITDVDWGQAMNITALAAVVSLLTSIASTPSRDGKGSNLPL